MPMERQTTLLLVEDEDRLRSLVAQFLRAGGLRVVEAGDGDEALERYRDGGPFDLVVMDMNLPRLAGVDVCRAIRRLDPGQPVLVCSAAILPDCDEELRELGGVHRLTKPFLPEALRRAIEVACAHSGVTLAAS
jgi:CheY-like chemotaxis protein